MKFFRDFFVFTVILGLLFTPSYGAFGGLVVPTGTIIIVKNTISADGVFNFNTNQAGVLPPSFSLQTMGNTASRAFSGLTAFQPNSYNFTEIVPEGWKLNSIVCNSSGANSHYYIYLDDKNVSINLAPWETVTCAFTNAQVLQRNPVLIIPGIMGSELYNGDDLIWADLSQMFGDFGDRFITDNLSLDSQGNSIVSGIEAKDVIREISLYVYKIDIFKSLFNKDLEPNNYQFNQSYFVFPYDWRLDLEITKLKLQQMIESIKQQSGSNKVDIIAHSMGGLLVKDYINSFGKSSINKLIFISTPHLGAPKAARVLLEGDNFAIPWLEKDRIEEVASNSPAVYELLPNQKYFDQFVGYIKPYKFLGPRITYNYQETKDFLINEKQKNSLLFQKAEEFFAQNLEDTDFSGIDTYNIIGCGNQTEASYAYAFGNKFIGQLGYTSGDKTVPLIRNWSLVYQRKVLKYRGKGLLL